MKSRPHDRNKIVTISVIFGLLVLMLLASANTQNSTTARETSAESYDLYGTGQVSAEFVPENNKGPSDIYIKFDGVDGEVQNISHQGWCEVVAFNQAHIMQQTSTGPSRGSTTALFEDFRIVKTVDKASPKLAEAVCKASVYPTVKIHLTSLAFSTGRVTYLAFELKNVLITSYGISGSGQNEEVPTEEVTLSFEQIKMTYTEFDAAGKAKGNVEYTWIPGDIELVR